jgi:hypothetical protein
MIPFLLKLLERLAASIEAAAKRETAKCEAALKTAAEHVQKANGHRTTARKAYQVSSALKDVTGVAQPVAAAPAQEAAPQ